MSTRVMKNLNKKMLLNGKWTSKEEEMEIRNPQDNSIIGTVPLADERDAEIALEAAVEGAETARLMPVHQRISILQKASEEIESRVEEFAKVIAMEGIKTIRESRKEVERCAATLRISSEEARQIKGETIPFDQQPGSENKVGYYTREPIGIIVAITPFNDPLNLVAHKVGPAIAGGNAIILKPHNETPFSALMLAEVFVNAGLPENVLQVLTGRGRVIGKKLITDERVRMVSFTGGRETGESIIKMAGLKKVSMELGSNAPTIVMNDADIDLAVPSTVSGAFWAAGQNCLHVQRLFVHEEIYGTFVDRFITMAKEYKVGDKMGEDTDMGPLINEKAAKKVEAIVNEALAEGANLLMGGTRDGNFYAPTLIENVPYHSELNSEEVYGPVTIIESFAHFNDAVKRANDVDYGLQAAIFTSSLDTAFKGMSELRVGGVMINDSTDYRIDAMPFGGTKGSGLGREGVHFTIMDMTEPKVSCFTLK
ncbi:aldehyde dehydrogenase family protein [Virgibacillus sp. W0181]|uniref:aldehyde dehydrogenase family protein n=1 Tax=Virgibacillus sp. W0181 TaxID=3391581 RepID=UPI003F48922A